MVHQKRIELAIEYGFFRFIWFRIYRQIRKATIMSYKRGKNKDCRQSNLMDFYIVRDCHEHIFLRQLKRRIPINFDILIGERSITGRGNPDRPLW